MYKILDIHYIFMILVILQSLIDITCLRCQVLVQFKIIKIKVLFFKFLINIELFELLLFDNITSIIRKYLLIVKYSK